MRQARQLVLLAVLALLTGCATSPTDEGLRALNAGDVNRAEALFQQGIDQGDVAAINNLGVVWQRRGDRARAVAYYTRAARYGFPLAQQNLRNLGEDVPAVDLAHLAPVPRAPAPQRTWGDVLSGLAISAGAGYAASRPDGLQPGRQLGVDTAWDWDQFADENGRWVWACRGVQTGQFADDHYCRGLVRIDGRWPGLGRPF